MRTFSDSTMSRKYREYSKHDIQREIFKINKKWFLKVMIEAIQTLVDTILGKFMVQKEMNKIITKVGGG